MVVKFIIFVVIVFSMCDTSWCATSWSPFASNRSKVYVGSESQNREAEEVVSEPLRVDEKKKKPFMDMSWLRNMEPPKFNFKRPNNIQIVPTNTDGYETGSMTDEDSKPSYTDSPRSLKTIEDLEEKVRRAQEELTEARARVRQAEQIENLQARKQQEEKALVIAHEDEAKVVMERSQNREAVIDKFSTRLNDVHQSARLAQARAIKEEILAKKAEKEAMERVRKEAFEAERQTKLQYSDDPRIQGAERCFVNADANSCEQEDGCKWNSLIKTCDIDCNSVSRDRKCFPVAYNNRKLNPREIDIRQRKCHSIIGIRKKIDSEGDNESIIVSKQYDTQRICSLISSNGCCVERAGRF